MRYRIMVVPLMLGLMIALGITTWAQETESKAVGMPGQLDAIRKASALAYATIKNRQGEKLGDVKDLILDQKGRLRYVIAGRGGIVGVGAEHVGIPAAAVVFSTTTDSKWTGTVDITKEQFNAAPALKQEGYRELLDATWNTGNASFFRVEERETQKEKEPALTEILRVSKVLGSTLQSSAEPDQTSAAAKLGKVEDLLFDRNLRAVYAIIGSGGILGIGENYIPVPYQLLSCRINDKDSTVSITTDVTKNRLEMAPLVKGGTYTQLLSQDFVKLVNRHFGIGQSQ